MTGNNDAFKYDIAFSFVGEDEGLRYKAHRQCVSDFFNVTWGTQ
jgi:hypothetical protein